MRLRGRGNENAKHSSWEVDLIRIRKRGGLGGCGGVPFCLYNKMLRPRNIFAFCSRNAEIIHLYVRLCINSATVVYATRDAASIVNFQLTNLSNQINVISRFCDRRSKSCIYHIMLRCSVYTS